MGLGCHRQDHVQLELHLLARIVVQELVPVLGELAGMLQSPTDVVPLRFCILHVSSREHATTRALFRKVLLGH